MRITLELTGTTPLLCHNVQLADPDNAFVQQIKVLTAKKTNKTEDDRRSIERLEWFGGLYAVDGIDGPAMPTANLRKCLNEAAKMTRQGKQVERALLFLDLNVPIIYDGPRDFDKLFGQTEHHHRASVRVGMQRVMRVRPSFPHWSVMASAELLEDVMDPTDLGRILERAGLVEGLGDNRRNGYGRFVGKAVTA